MANMEQDKKPDGQSQPQFAIQKIYVKDLSFETPNSPSAFTQEWKPDVNVELDTKGQEVAEDVHRVDQVAVGAPAGDPVGIPAAPANDAGVPAAAALRRRPVPHVAPHPTNAVHRHVAREARGHRLHLHPHKRRLGTVRSEAACGHRGRLRELCVCLYGSSQA